MQAEITGVLRMQEGYVVKGTVNGHPVSVDFPTSYIDKLDREAGREYMRRSLIKVFCATMGIDTPESIHAGR